MSSLIDKNISYYSDAYDKCLNIVEYGSNDYKRDTALGMVVLLIKAHNYPAELESGLILRLAVQSFDNTAALYNLRDLGSEPLGIFYEYSHSPNAMKNLSKFDYLSLSKLRSLKEMLTEEIDKYRGGSPMSDQMYNIQGKSMNRIIIEKCIKIFERNTDE
ncbi:MAG: hypothetical protein ACI93R_003713 [Flavobacteriales bacterium]|jgi:hypothetical protein